MSHLPRRLRCNGCISSWCNIPSPRRSPESEAQVRDIATIAGHPERGQALAKAIEAAAEPLPGRRVSALIWESGGPVPGSGTLADELMTRAGFRNMSASYGLKQWDVLPLEYLVARPPRVVLSTAAAATGTERLTTHPAMAALAKRITVAPYAGRLLSCGGPTIIAAMARLRTVRSEVTR